LDAYKENDVIFILLVTRNVLQTSKRHFVIVGITKQIVSSFELLKLVAHFADAL